MASRRRSCARSGQLEADGLLRARVAGPAAWRRSPRQVRWARHHRRPGWRSPRASRRASRPAGPPLGSAPARAPRRADGARHATASPPRGWRAHTARRPVTGLARRGLLALETATVERRPLAGRRRRSAAAGPPARRSTPTRRRRSRPSARPSRPATARRSSSRARPASGKTAVYAAGHRGRRWRAAAARSCSCPRSRSRRRSSTGCGTTSASTSRMLHSALGDGERADEWRRIRDGEARVVVGTRIAVLCAAGRRSASSSSTRSTTPAYKSDRTPRYQARDVAVVLGRLARCAGRARLARRRTSSTRRSRASRAPSSAPAPRRPRSGRARRAVEVVDMRDELAAGNRGLLSAPLVDAHRRGSTGRPASAPSCSSTGAARPASCSAATAATSRSARSASGRSSSTPSVMALRCHHCGATRPGGATLPGVRLGAHPLPRRRHRARRAGARACASRSCAWRASTATSSSAGARRPASSTPSRAGRGGRARRARASSPRASTSPRSRSSASSPRTSRSTCPTSAPPSGPGSCSPRRSAVPVAASGPGRAIVQTYLPDHAVIRAVASGDAAAVRRRRAGAAPNRFGSPPFGQLIKLTVRWRTATRRSTTATRDGRRAAGAGRGERRERRGARARCLPTSPGAAAAGASTSSSAAATRAAVLGGDPGAPGRWTSIPRACSEARPARRGCRRAGAPLYSAPMTVRPILTLGDPRLRLRRRARRQLRQVPPRAARRPDPHDARRARRRPGGSAGRRAAAGLRHRGRGPAPRAGQPAHRARSGDDRDLEGCLSIPGYVAYVTRQREGLGRGPEPPRPRIKLDGQRPAGARRPARARPPRRQALHRLPRVVRRAHPRVKPPRGGGRGRGRRCPSSPDCRRGRTVTSPRTLFLGSGAFAVPIARARSRDPGLVDLVAVVTAPPRPAGRAGGRSDPRRSPRPPG